MTSHPKGVGVERVDARPEPDLCVLLSAVLSDDEVCLSSNIRVAVVSGTQDSQGRGLETLLRRFRQWRRGCRSGGDCSRRRWV